MLGSLEKKVLSVLRQEKRTIARDIFEILRKKGVNVAYVTVNTVLSRLQKRGLVKSIKEPYRGKYRYIYEYIDIKDQLISDFLWDVDLLFGDDGVAHLKMLLEDDKLRTAEGIQDFSTSINGTTTDLRVRISRHDIRNSIIRKIEEISGQNVLACYQCGKCSAGCPMVTLMDMLPNQIIRLVQLGQIDDALSSKTIWLCASCFSCSARCPKGVDLAKVMEALRLLLLRKHENYVEPSEIEIDENLPQIALISNLRKMTG